MREGAARRFFRRLAEGVFDEEDIRRRVGELDLFLTAAATHYGFDRRRVVALGYSNGANLAAATLQRVPGFVAGAVLWRAMVPLPGEPPVEQRGTQVLLRQGQMDPMGSPAQTEHLARLLRATGASVDVQTELAGHSLVSRDVTATSQWLGQQPW